MNLYYFNDFILILYWFIKKFYLNSEILSNHPKFQNIRVHGLWKQPKIQKQGLSAILSAENLLIEFTRIYKEVYQNSGVIIQRHVNYYDFIRYTVQQEPGIYTNITLRVGEAISIEADNNLGEQAYALIRAIIIHQDDFGNNNPFLLIDWNGNIDTVIGFLQPLIIVDQQPKVHFVHKCTSICSEESHDINNNEYILNDFYLIV